MPLDQERLRQLKEAEARELAAATNLRGAFEVEREITTQWAPPPVIEEKDTSFLGEAGRAVWGAIVDAASETALFVADMFSGVSSDVTSELLAAGLTPERAQAIVQSAERGADESIKKIRSAVDVIAPDNETTAGNLARGVGQFLVPFLGWSRVVRAAGVTRSVPNGFVAGFATDITAFDPNAGNLSALIEQFPALSNPVTEFLATSPDDDEAVNRLRNGLEGLAIGGFLEPFVQVLRLYRMRRAAQQAEDARVTADTEPAPALDAGASQSAADAAKGPAPVQPAPDEMVTVYHGSPHLFERFDISKIGSGEGAQKFGFGLYVAESPRVGDHYRVSTSFADIVRKWSDELPDDADFEDALKLANEGKFGEAGKRFMNALAADDWLGFDSPAQAISAAVSKDAANYDMSPALQEAIRGLGHSYEAEIPARAVANMLDWDKPIAEQPQAVRELAETWGITSGTGRTVLQAAERRAGGARGAAELLKGLGVPGVRYLDATSRRAGEGTRNFVVFDDTLLRIRRIDGKPVAQEPESAAKPSSPPASPEVRHTVDDTGAHMVEVEGGFVDAQETDGFLQVKNARVEESQRGKGLGRAMYERLIEEAEARGLKLASDVSVSPDAQRVWASFERRGYQVTRNEAEVNPETGNLVSVDPRKPVFVLEGRPAEGSGVARTSPGTGTSATPKAEPEATPKAEPEAPPKAEPEAPPPSLSQRLRAALQITPQQRAALIRAVEQEDYSTASGLLNFNEHTIDWESLDEGDNIRQLLNTFSEIIAENIDTAKGGVQTLVQTQRLAALVGTSADQVHRLYRDTRGNKGLTARMLAAERTLLASAQRLRRLAQEAKNAPAEKYSQARLALHRHIELHAALMAEVKGAKTEIARALHAMRLMKSAAEESFKEFDEIRRTLGGHADGDAIIDALLSARSLRDLNTVVTRTRGRRWRDAIIELSVNGLLSQPKTHLANMASNALNAALMTGDRYLAGVWRATRGDLRLLREANADLIGKLQALDDAFRLALRAFREGMPITDVKQRVEVDQRRAITHELFKGVDESSAFGRIVNLIGGFIRLPGRFLMAGDEFFKTITVRGETAALAYRQAVHEAERRNLKGVKFDQYVQRRRVELFTQPSPTIMSEALKRARYATFQEAPRTAAGMNLERFVHSSAFVKIVIVPFFRTPMNILRQAAVDRTPFALLLSDTRRVLAQGGPEADIMAARMFTGMGALVAGYSLVSSGGPDKPFEIVGKRPIGNTAGEDGVLDYSIRLGDTWFQFNRLDPVGTWLGMMADIKDYMELEYDPADPQSAEVGFALTQAAFGALLKNTLNKSWFASVQEILDAFQQIEKGKPETVQRAVDRLLASNAIKLVPYSAALRGGSTTAEALVTGADVEVKEAWSFVERLQSNFAFLNDGLPPKRDYLGRPITRHNSAWFAVNPFATSPESTDPLDRELARLAFDFQILPKSIDNGKVPLNAAQYSELKRLIGQEPFLGGQSLEQVLRDLVTSDAYASLPSDQVRIDVIKGLYEDAKAIAVEMLKEQNGGELRRKSIERQFGEVSRRAGQPIELPAFPTSQ